MSNRFCIKFVAQDASLDEETLIPVFHEWIRERKLPGVMFDVVDYRHVPEGPGIMLITHEINYAMEHGNEYQADLPVKIEVLQTVDQLKVRITDQGGEQAIPAADTPDLDAKLAGEQSPRGWGLFLIKNMVDEMETFIDGKKHTIELGLNLQGGGNV